jgi:hypothetical protein
MSPSLVLVIASSSRIYPRSTGPEAASTTLSEVFGHVTGAAIESSTVLDVTVPAVRASADSVEDFAGARRGKARARAEKREEAGNIAGSL